MHLQTPLCSLVHNRICRFQESYCDAVVLKAMEIMVEVDKYCLKNPLFQSMLNYKHFIFLFLYGIQPYLFIQPRSRT